MKNKYLNYYCLAILFLFFQVLLLFSTALNVSASSIAKEFTSAKEFTVGTLLSSKPDNKDELETTNVFNDKYFVGVVQENNQSIVAISSDPSNVSVVIGGEVDVLATDINGQISKGDLVTVSWIEGVAMKQQQGSGQRILGVAQEDFNTNDSSIYSGIQTPSKNNASAKVGQLKIRMTGSDTYVDHNTNDSTGLITRITGKEVNLLRVIIGLLALLSTILLAGVFAYSSIRSSFISFGRNPLASSSIYLGLLQTSSMSVAIIAVGSTLAYFIWVL